MAAPKNSKGKGQDVSIKTHCKNQTTEYGISHLKIIFIQSVDKIVMPLN